MIDNWKDIGLGTKIAIGFLLFFVALTTVMVTAIISADQQTRQQQLNAEVTVNGETVVVESMGNARIIELRRDGQVVGVVSRDGERIDVSRGGEIVAIGQEGREKLLKDIN